MADSSARPDRLDALARQIRGWYVTAYREAQWKQRGLRTGYGEKPIPRWDGDLAPDGRRRPPIWRRVAEFVLAQQLDAQILIRAMSAGPEPETPLPSMLVGNSALSRYRQYRQWLDEDLAVALGSNIAAFKNRRFFWINCGMPEDSAGRCTLAASDQSFSPLFRYFLASLCGWADLADKYRDQALSMYLSDRDGYDRVWADAIPDALKRRADDFLTPGAAPRAGDDVAQAADDPGL